MKPCHAIEAIFDEHGLKLQWMAGAIKNNITFRVRSSSYHDPGYGACRGTVITLGIATKFITDFDLRDPDSIEAIDKFIESGKMWWFGSKPSWKYVTNNNNTGDTPK